MRSAHSPNACASVVGPVHEINDVMMHYLQWWGASKTQILSIPLLQDDADDAHAVGVVEGRRKQQ